MPNETCSFNIVSNLYRNPFCALCRGTKTYNGEWERARWREGAAIGVEFILFTFSRNPVMIASYKIDEICHKNEDVCFYVYRAVGVYKSRFSVSIFLLCCALLLALSLFRPSLRSVVPTRYCSIYYGFGCKSNQRTPLCHHKWIRWKIFLHKQCETRTRGAAS